MGSLCTSMMRPSLPQAAAASAIGRTRRAMPVAWLGSTMTGRCVSSLSIGTAARSRVFLV